MATAKTRKKRTMSDDHKEALAAGRSEGGAVRRYLIALETHRPKRGRKRTPDSMQKRLDTINDTIETADPVKRLGLIQERYDLEQALSATGETVDMTELEDGFVSSAKAYGQRKGITYAAWREFGVEAAVLKRSGITRAGN